MSTRGTIHFETSSGGVLHFYIGSDAYDSRVIHTLWDIKMLCDSGLMSWRNFYAFLKKYDGCSITNFLVDDAEDLEKWVTPKLEYFFEPFDDGYIERTGVYDGPEYGWVVGYKINSIEGRHGDNFDPGFIGNARQYFIKFIFDDKTAWGIIKKI